MSLYEGFLLSTPTVQIDIGIQANYFSHTSESGSVHLLGSHFTTCAPLTYPSQQTFK